MPTPMPILVPEDMEPEEEEEEEESSVADEEEVEFVVPLPDGLEDEEEGSGSVAATLTVSPDALVQARPPSIVPFSAACFRGEQSKASEVVRLRAPWRVRREGKETLL